ncbi:hypothetical protein H5407_18175, partial [Mitsuaria sp. WAJ17]|nr:hypothetical protein [Mitsuaria sp. WAJ17]
MSRASPAPRPAHRLAHRPGRGLAAAVGLALLAHAWLLTSWPTQEAPA